MSGLRSGPTIVLCPNGLPSSDAWTAELQGVGLDIEVHPTSSISDDWLVVPMSVRGHLAVLSFHGLSSLSRCQWWFPSEVPTIHQSECVFMSFDKTSGVERERVADWAAAGSLSRLSAALVFDREGMRADLAEIAYDMAREMIVILPPKPHQNPGDRNLDFRTHFARVYDDGIDPEGGDSETAMQLQKAAFRVVMERRRMGERAQTL